MVDKVKVSPQFKRLCTQFRKILGGKSEVDAGPVCFVTHSNKPQVTMWKRGTWRGVFMAKKGQVFQQYTNEF